MSGIGIAVGVVAGGIVGFAGSLVASAVVGYVFFLRQERDAKTYEQERFEHLDAIRASSQDLFTVIKAQEGEDTALFRLAGGLNHNVAKLVARSAQHVKSLDKTFGVPQEVQTFIDDYYR